MSGTRRADAIRHYAEVVASEGLYSDPGRLLFYLRYLFGTVDLEGCRVLDIGGGAGWVSFYAATLGAREVVCMEPILEGSNAAVPEQFCRLADRLQLNQVRLETSTLQEFEVDDRAFDVVLMNNSVNHVEEEACITLRSDPESRRRYEVLFERLARLSAPGSHLIVTDCSNQNFFAALGVRNPFARSIEWHKHQSPWVWAELLTEAGFRDPQIRWASFSMLGKPGRVLLGNRVAAYFLQSHFCLVMKRAKSAP